MANDSWRTPLEVFNYFNRTYDFMFDACADDKNYLHGNYLTEKDDFLDGGLRGHEMNGEFAWCNPPYSNPLPFVRRCIFDSIESGIGYVMLLNHDMSTKWATILTRLDCTIVVFTGKRIAFLNDKGIPVKNNNKGQIAVIIPPFVRQGEARTKYIPLVDVMSMT